MIRNIDTWIINHAAYPGLFVVFLALLFGSVIIPYLFKLIIGWVK